MAGQGIDLSGKADSIWDVFPAWMSDPLVAEQGEVNNESGGGGGMWGSLAASFLSGLGQGAGGGGAAPAQATPSQYVNFDTGAFTVATSGSKADGTGSAMPWYVWVIAGVVVIRIMKAK